MIVTDPRDSSSCWSRAEVSTPDAIVHVLACERGRHLWGRHRNDHVTWKCPARCGCVRHARGPRRPDTTGETETPPRRLTEQQGGIPNDAITPDDPYQRGIRTANAIVCFTHCYACQFDYHFDPPQAHTWMDKEDAEHAGHSWPLPDDIAAKNPCACQCADQTRGDE